MAREVIGYLADDATFFEDQRDAELHDANASLRKRLRDLGIHPDKFIDAAMHSVPEIRRFFDANDAIAQRYDPEIIDDPNLPEHDPDPKAVEDSLDSLQHKPLSGR